MRVERSVVVGAGIAGLTAALALRDLCSEVVVLERAGELRPLGAGIALWPNAIKVLHRLGVGEAVEAAGAVATQSRIYTEQGDPVTVDVSGEFSARFGAPLMLLHRAALHEVLMGALPPGSLRLGEECVGVDQRGDTANVRLASGGSEEAELVVGADGIRSTVRAALFGDEPARFSGIVAWRGLVQLDPDAVSRLAVGEYWGSGALFGIARLGGVQVYWYAADRAPETSDEDDAAELAKRFASWRSPIPELLDSTPEILRTPLYERPPLARWSEGRIGLLGDAAHPMMPNLGQGAAQAIEDAAALAEALEQNDSVSEALQRYGEARRGRVNLVVKRSRQMAKLAHTSNPVLVRLRNAFLRRASAEATLNRMTPIIGGGP
jgi:2-polyprenyl-6-methoxyphenol hydroxylase-like FAD-dependent oxidoreductase